MTKQNNMLMGLWELASVVSLITDTEILSAPLYVARYTNYSLALKLNFIFNWNPIYELAECLCSIPRIQIRNVWYWALDRLKNKTKPWNNKTTLEIGGII